MNNAPPRRVRRRRIAVAAVVLVSFGVLAALAPLIVSGRRLGLVIGWALPATRGALSVGGGEWSWGAVWAVWRGRPAPLRLNDIRVVDPEGTEVLRVDEITGTIELARDRSRLVLRGLHIRNARWRFAQMKTGRDVGFLAAFQSVRRTTARPRTARGGLAWFSIEGADLDGVDAVFDFPSWGLALTDVHARAGLAVAAAPAAVAAAPAAPGGTATAVRPIPVFSFEVLDADLRAGGLLRILSGQARTELPFASGRIDRVAIPAARPSAIELRARDVATGRSRLALEAAFLGPTGSGGARTSGGIELRAQITDAADAVRAALARRFAGAGQRAAPAPVTVAGAGADLSLDVSGAFEQVRIEATARGFDVGTRGLTFVGLGGTLTAEPIAGRARLRGLGFSSPGGGRLALDAELDRLMVRGTLAFDHFVTTPYLPGFLRSLAGGVIDGRVRAGFDLIGRSATLDEVALDFTGSSQRANSGPARRRFLLTSHAGAAAGARGDATQSLRVSGARFAGGTLILPEVGAALAGGTVSARARVTLLDAAGRMQPPIFDVDAQARRLSFARLAGATFARGDLSFRARVRGTLDDLAVTVDVPASERLNVFGEPCRLPTSTTFRFDGDDLILPAAPDFRLRGDSGAELAVAGRIGRTGDLGLMLDVRRFPIAKLPALVEAELPVSGTLSGRMQAAGSIRAPRLAGQITIDDARLLGQPLGGGTLAITAGAGGAIHGAGQVIQGVTLDGTLAPAGGGDVRGVATLRLDAVKLDPLLALLPGGAHASGVITGTLEARVAPRVPAELQARLSRLALSVATSSSAGAPRLELHAVEEVRVSARARGGLRIEAARFAGTPGTVELTGELGAAGRAHGEARGRLALGALAPLFLPWTDGALSRMAGDLDFDVGAQTARAGAPPVVTGTLRVATPLSFRARALPVDARVDTGTLRLQAGGVVTVDVPVTLGAGTVRVTGLARAGAGGAPRIALDAAGDLDAALLALAAPRAIAWSTGGVRVDAHVEGDPRRPFAPGDRGLRLRARLRPAALALALRAAPALPVRISGGEIVVDDQTLTVHALRVDAGGQAQVTIGADADGPAVAHIGALTAPRPGRVSLPVRGHITATTIAPLVIDDASFALRLDGDLSRRARLAGEIDLVRAHIPPGAGKKAARPAAPPGAARSAPSPTASLLRRAELAHIDLDVHARSQGGAVTVEINNLPDVRVDIDYRVRGTPQKPQISGQLEGDGVWSSFALLLRRLFG